MGLIIIIRDLESESCFVESKGAVCVLRGLVHCFSSVSSSSTSCIEVIDKFSSPLLCFLKCWYMSIYTIASSLSTSIKM